MSLEKPRMLNKHFAEDADPKTLHTIPDVPDPNDIAQRPSLASYSTGFPPRSMAPPQAGGQPFYGQDVNGILKDVSANVQYVQAGNYYPFDSEFQKAVGGYNKFAVVLNSDDGKLYQSLVDNNTAPLSDKKSWVFFTEGRYLSLTGGELSGTLTVKNSVVLTGDWPSVYFRYKKGDNVSKTGYFLLQDHEDFVLKQFQGDDGKATDKIAQYSRETDTWDFNVSFVTNKKQSLGVYVGEFRNFPFRKNKLPKGWYPRDGVLYDLTSDVGKVLNSFDDDFKSDWGIEVTNGKINIPNAFDENGNGFFERPVNGNDRQVGGLQGDAIRNIKGSFYTTNYHGQSLPEGAFYFTNKNVDAHMQQQAGDDWRKEVGFDPSKVVPTADENRPINIGMTPAIYLGV